MITVIEVKSRTPFVGGAALGAAGAYERIDAVAIGELDPAHPANRGIVNIDRAPRNARGRVEYRSDVCILRPGHCRAAREVHRVEPSRRRCRRVSWPIVTARTWRSRRNAIHPPRRTVRAWRQWLPSCGGKGLG